MPTQTGQKNLLFPDGCAFLVRPAGEVDFFDVGVIEGDVTNTFNYDEVQVETANAGQTAKRYKNMTVDIAVTINSLNPIGVQKLSSGLMSVVETDGSPVTTIPDQIVAAGWDDNKVYELVVKTSSSDSTELRLASKPVLTSVTLDATGTPEVLAENTEYVIVQKSDFKSGWGLQFISANMATASPKTLPITIDYGTNTPVASTVVKCGSSSIVASACEIKFQHTDSSGLVRSFYLPKAEANSGGFQFNFKGANADGLESMPLAFTGRLDTDRADGDQLFQWYIENGAA